MQCGLSVMGACDAQCPIPFATIFGGMVPYNICTIYTSRDDEMAQKNMRRVCFDTLGVKVGSSQADNTNIATNSIRDIRYKDEHQIVLGKSEGSDNRRNVQ